MNKQNEPGALRTTLAMAISGPKATDSALRARESEMLAQFPNFPSLGGHGPVQLIRAIAQLGEIGTAFEHFNRSLMTAGRLEPATRELVILRVAWLRRCSYIWGGHALIARDVGLQLSVGGDAPRAEHGLAIAVTNQLIDGSLDKTWHAAATEMWGHDGLLEMSMVVGQYTLLSLAIDVLGLTSEPGTPRLPRSWPGPAAGVAPNRSLVTP